MDKQQLIDIAVKTAYEAEIKYGYCARNVLIGIQKIFSEIPDEMVTASLSLAAGTGAASGSCGAYCSGLLSVGLKFNCSLENEIKNPELQEESGIKFKEYRDRFLSEWGTVMCPVIQEKLFGRKFDLTDPDQDAEFVALEDHLEKCSEVVCSATRIAAEMILAD